MTGIRLRSRALPYSAGIIAATFCGVVLSAAVAWLIGAGHGSTVIVVAIAIVGALAVGRWPGLTLISLLVVCQELQRSGGFGASSTGLLFLGHQLYFTTFHRISVITLVTVICALRVSLVAPPRGLRKVGVTLVLILGVYSTALLWTHDVSLTSAINQDSRYAIIFVACFVVGGWARDALEWRRHAESVLLAIFTLMALVGLYLAATGQGELDSGTRIIFYDAALGAAAGAVVVAVLMAPAAARTRKVWCLGAAALIVVALSARRDVWAAMVVALLIGLIYARARARLVIRGLVVLGALLIAAELFLPSLMSTLGHQLSSVWQASQGTAADASTKGHLTDISVGWAAVLHSPWSGVGPNGHLLGLVVENGGPLYLHNQVLDTWLRFGLLGAALILGVQIALVAEAIPVLRQHGDQVVISWAAYLVIMAPAAMVTAPFLTTTQRWPGMVGFAAGLVAARPRQGGQRDLVKPAREPSATAPVGTRARVSAADR